MRGSRGRGDSGEDPGPSSGVWGTAVPTGASLSRSPGVKLGYLTLPLRGYKCPGQLGLHLVQLCSSGHTRPLWTATLF